ncbi:MAG: hypothetical protein QM669_07235 [Siphonobacter sp.]
MKYILVLLFLSVNAYGQWYLKTGASLNTDHISYSVKSFNAQSFAGYAKYYPSYFLGVGYNQKITNKFNIQFSGGYNHRRKIFKNTPEIVHYLSIELLPDFKLSRQFHLKIGPMTNILIVGDVDNSSTLPRFENNVLAELGYCLNQYELALTYTKSINSFINTQAKNGLEISQAHFYNQSLGLRLYYYFNK